jgi:hypothetical protein
MWCSFYAPFKPERQDKDNQAKDNGTRTILKKADQHAASTDFFEPVRNTLQHTAALVSQK